MTDRRRFEAVDHPPHYLVGGMETIDVLRAKLSPSEYQGYLRGCAVKYLLRLGHKGSREQWAEDARKAAWYCTRLADDIDPQSTGEAS